MIIGPIWKVLARTRGRYKDEQICSCAEFGWTLKDVDRVTNKRVRFNVFLGGDAGPLHLKAEKSKQACRTSK